MYDERMRHYALGFFVLQMLEMPEQKKHTPAAMPKADIFMQQKTISASATKSIMTPVAVDALLLPKNDRIKQITVVMTGSIAYAARAPSALVPVGVEASAAAQSMLQQICGSDKANAMTPSIHGALLFTFCSLIFCFSFYLWI